MNNKNDILERLAIIADVLQVANYQLNTQQASNDDIIKALDEQNKKYLKNIIERLERLENNDKRNNN